MPVSSDLIKELILKALPDSQVTVQDTVGDGDHLQATVISPLFEGKKLLARHQIVYKALGETLKEKLHSLSLKTVTPEEQGK